MEESLGKALMLKAERNMGKFERLMNRFPDLTWDELTNMVMVGVWQQEDRYRLLKLCIGMRRLGARAPSPTQVIYKGRDLELMLRQLVPESFHIADHVGGVTGIASIVFEEEEDYDPWGYYNPHLLIANFGEGGFAKITGPPRSGKTNTACVILEQWLQESNRNHAVTNITIPRDEHDRLHFVKTMDDFFDTIEELPSGDHFVFAFDEGGLIYDRRHDSARRSSTQLDKLPRVIGKMLGNMIWIEQSEESVPRLQVEFSSASFRCYRPGIVSVLLRPDMPTSKAGLNRVFRQFPRTVLPYKTHDVAAFEVAPGSVERKLAEMD